MKTIGMIDEFECPETRAALKVLGQPIAMVLRPGMVDDDQDAHIVIARMWMASGERLQQLGCDDFVLKGPFALSDPVHPYYVVESRKLHHKMHGRTGTDGWIQEFQEATIDEHGLNPDDILMIQTTSQRVYG